MLSWMRCAALAAVVLVPLAPADTDGCPNTKASEVAARIEDVGRVRRCSVGLVLFGFGGGLFGDDCPASKLFYPAHQVCSGESNPRTRCAPQGPISVSKEDCKCGGLVIPYIEVGVPLECVCTEDDAGGGHIEDFETVSC